MAGRQLAGFNLNNRKDRTVDVFLLWYSFWVPSPIAPADPFCPRCKRDRLSLLGIVLWGINLGAIAYFFASL